MKERRPPTKRPSRPPNLTSKSRGPSRGTAGRSELKESTPPRAGSPSSVDVAMTPSAGRRLAPGTCVRDRNVRFYKAGTRRTPTTPRSAGPASSLQLERPAPRRDLLYARTDARLVVRYGGPPRHRGVHRRTAFRIGTGAQKYLAGRRTDLKLGREPKESIARRRASRRRSDLKRHRRRLAAAGRGDARREDRRDALRRRRSGRRRREDLGGSSRTRGPSAEPAARAQDAAQARAWQRPSSRKNRRASRPGASRPLARWSSSRRRRADVAAAGCGARSGPLAGGGGRRPGRGKVVGFLVLQ